MDELFFEELELSSPKYKLSIKSSAPFRQGEHTGKMLIAIEEILLKEKPNLVFAHGDTNTALAASLVASKITTTSSYTGRVIKLAHLEAGLRSFDTSMPEEINRKIIDHLSNYLFPPTEIAKKNIINEGISNVHTIITGNTIVDSVYQNIILSEEKCDVLDRFQLEKSGYFLVTVHRQECVDNKKRLQNVIHSLGLISKNYLKPVIFPMHPRTKKMIDMFKIIIPKGLMIIEPVGFLEFLQLESNALLNLTDSGGVQEESCILNVPCVTLRNNTERPETINCGSNIIAGYNPKKIVSSVEKMLSFNRGWKNPFGNGKASETIIKYIINNEKSDYVY